MCVPRLNLLSRLREITTLLLMSLIDDVPRGLHRGRVPLMVVVPWHRVLMGYGSHNPGVWSIPQWSYDTFLVIFQPEAVEC